MAAAVGGAQEAWASGIPPLPPDLVSLVVGYAQDKHFNDQIAKAGRVALEQLSPELLRAMGSMPKKILPNWDLLHLTTEQLANLKLAYPLAANVARSLDEQAEDGMFNHAPAIRVTLKDKSVRVVIASALTATALSGWPAELVNAQAGRFGMKPAAVDFARADIESVTEVAADFDTWAEQQLGGENSA